MPNIKRIATLTGKTKPYLCTSTLSSVLENPTSSGKLFRIYLIRATNIGTDPARIYVSVRRSGVDTFLARRNFINGNETLIVLNKSEYLYLEEGDEIFASCDVAGPVHLTVVYDEVTPP